MIKPITQVKPSGADVQQDYYSVADNLIKILKAWKELISLVVFFVGCVLWITGYFATKKQLAELRCFAKENIAFVRSESGVRAAFDDLVSKSEKLERLKKNYVQNQSSQNEIIRLEREVKDLEEQHAAMKLQYIGAQKKLIDGACSQE